MWVCGVTDNMIILADYRVQNLDIPCQVRIFVVLYKSNLEEKHQGFSRQLTKHAPKTIGCHC